MKSLKSVKFNYICIQFYWICFEEKKHAISFGLQFLISIVNNINIKMIKYQICLKNIKNVSKKIITKSIGLKLSDMFLFQKTINK